MKLRKALIIECKSSLRIEIDYKRSDLSWNLMELTVQKFPQLAPPGVQSWTGR